MRAAQQCTSPKRVWRLCTRGPCGLACAHPGDARHDARIVASSERMAGMQDRYSVRCAAGARARACLRTHAHARARVLPQACWPHPCMLCTAQVRKACCHWRAPQRDLQTAAPCMMRKKKTCSSKTGCPLPAALYNSFFRWKNFRRYHSCHTPDRMQTTREPSEKYATRVFVISATTRGSSTWVSGVGVRARARAC